MTELLQFDEWLFRWINIACQDPLLDYLVPVWRNKYLWGPLYLFILSFILINFPLRKGMFWILGLVICVFLCDGISSQVIKKSVQRPRPCHTEVLETDIIVRITCGSGYSFPSSHATNHFGVAVFMILTLGRRFRLTKWPLLLWAASIALAQVYVGVHYPLDVFCGALLGTLIGTLLAIGYKRGVGEL